MEIHVQERSGLQKQENISLQIKVDGNKLGIGRSRKRTGRGVGDKYLSSVNKKINIMLI